MADNGAQGRYPTRTALDTQGKPLAVFDALGRRVFEYCLHEAGGYVGGSDLAGNALYQSGMDGGARRKLSNVAGKPIRGWDARGFATRKEYDPSHRPLRVFVQPLGGAEILAERMVYGEAAAGGGAAGNLRGRKILHYDGAGELSLTSYDFKGELTMSTRRLAVAYRQTPDWSPLAVPTDAGEVAATAAPLLEAEPFTTTKACDALHRAIRTTAPDASTSVPTYDETGQLQRLDVYRRGAVTPTPFVANLDYNPRGQRVRIEHGNGTTTTYAYDPLTFALARQTTTRTRDNRKLQDFALTYDPVRNVVQIDDDADPSLYFSGSMPVPGGGLYEYDAIYRLTSATGREHPGQQMPDPSDAPLASLPHPNDTQAMRAYSELYGYDQVGNILKVLHKAAGAGWTRNYRYAPDSNRLARTSLPGDPDRGPYSAVYDHDAAGNMTSMPHLAAIGWDHVNRMASADLGGGGTAFYTYDGGGARVRKVIERIGARVEERIYLGGYEIYRQRTGASVDQERQTLHVMDDEQRVAMVETSTVGGGAAGAPRVRYQLGNHLGSAGVEVDDGGRIISYEEYHPYGTSAYRAMESGPDFSAKRYRYTGKERDDETGLSHHASRSYAPWLGRWTSADPLALADGPNLYAYVNGRPISLHDPEGTRGKRHGAARVVDIKDLDSKSTKPQAFTYTAGGVTVKGQFIPGQTKHVALVFGGIHGSEKAGVEVGRRVIDGLLKPGAPKPKFTTIVIPDIWGGTQNQRNLPNGDDPNRSMPAAGKSVDESILKGEKRPRDARPGAKGHVIPKPIESLLRIREQFKPERILALHGIIVDPAKPNQPSITTDPRPDPALAKIDHDVTLKMAQVAQKEGARVPGNKLGTKDETVIYPTQVASHQAGVSFGAWGSHATSKAPAANVVTLETFNNDVPRGHGPTSQPRQQELDALAKSVTQVFLNK